MTKTILLALVACLACSGADSGQAVDGSAKGQAAEQTLMVTNQAAMPPEGDAAASQVRSVSPASDPANPSPGAAQAPVFDASAQPMLIRTGNATVEVDKLDPAVATLTSLAARLGGYITNSSVTGGRDEVRSATLELKVPAPRYADAVSGLSSLGKVENVNTTAQDVGEEFVDLTARINNARRLEERLLALLATRAGKLEDVLAVERELARVRREIDVVEGRLRYLRARTSMSTLTVMLHEPYPILGRTPGRNPIAAAIEQAWRNFVGFIASLIASLGVLIPLAILAALGYAGYRRFIRSRIRD